MNSPVYGLSFRQTGGLMDKQTDGQIDGYMEEWLGRHVDKTKKTKNKLTNIWYAGR
jgi:hypothetical protein